ncbi:hypothetical protein KC19_3G000200 [Ceratodon purpureus]|uniref:Uncharacterized protein n=1 Tax=Ceratodon purpureus TaxID=3225 RepID=A0A8T0IFS8_CERPU|nr:hypothetical protein KC19_3G000200 [Ceratodon purpureus]
MPSASSDPKERLNAFFKPYFIIPGTNDLPGDPEIYGDLWQYRHPEDVEWWSIPLTPMTHKMGVVTKYYNSDASLPVILDEAIIDIILAPMDFYCITCVVDDPSQEDEKLREYRYSYMINGVTNDFNIKAFIESLKNSDYEQLSMNTENHVAGMRFESSDGVPLPPKTLASRLKSLLTATQIYKAKLDKKKDHMQPIRLTQEVSIQSGSHESILYQTPDTRASGTRKRKTQPSQTERAPTKLKAVTTKKKSLMAEPMEEDPASLESALTDMPKDNEKKVTDYKESMEIFKNYWTQCQGSYIFGKDTKFRLPLKQLLTPPADINIRVLEQLKVQNTMNFLIQLPNKEKRNTLCVFPKDCTVKPTSWDEIKDGQFYMVNGQHCVEASKLMQKREDVDKEIRDVYKTWECFVVWDVEKSIIQKISAYYNRVNHFNNMNPTWATNILGACELWKSLGRPVPPKEATEVGRSVASKRTKSQQQSKDKYEEFLRAVKIRFALIDVKKAQKAAAGSKATKEKNTIANELKIITAPDEVYNVWADLIAANAQGELMDPESRKKFKELAKWKPENGIISKEFFKWLENTNYAQLKRLAEHLLNKPDEKRLYAYPKVTMKATKVAYPDCYSAFEWLERTKRKTIVKRQIHNLRPDYMLFSSSGDFMKSNWKKFKEDFAITSATLNVLLTAPGEEYFKEAKLSSSRNKAIADISPYAAEFFKVFLAHKGQFQIPKGSANFRAYNLENDKLSEWHDDAWNESEAQQRIKVHLDGCEFGANYRVEYAEYIPAKYERLEDVSYTTKKANDPVQILFLFRRTIKCKLQLPNYFNAPKTPKFTVCRKYNELRYRTYDTELRMEFYLKLLDLFCKEGDAIVTVFGGGKLSCAAWMCALENFIICPSEEKDRIVELARETSHLDRRDFESGYHVAESIHPTVKPVEVIVIPDSEKGKKKVNDSEVPIGEGSYRPITIGSDDDEAGGGMPDNDPWSSHVPFTPQTGHGSCSLQQQGHDQGFSDSSLPENTPPTKGKQAETDSTDSMWEKMYKMQLDQQRLHEKKVMELQYQAQERHK